MKSAIKFLLLLLGAGHSGITCAEVISTAPDAKVWASELNRKDLNTIKAPINIVVLQRFRKKKPKSIVKPVKFDHTACGKVSYISCIAPANFSYAVLINKLSVPPSEEDIMSMSGSNALIYNSGKTVKFTGLSSKEKIVIADTPKLSSSINTQVLFENLFKTLGYDGVVLAKKDDFILIGSLESRLQRSELQALVIRNSSSSFSTPQTQTKDGAALISMLNHSGGYAVFKTIIANNSASISIGDKIVIESGQPIGGTNLHPSNSTPPEKPSSTSDSAKTSNDTKE